MPIRVPTGVTLPSVSKALWPVPLYYQEASEWCWLACAKMMGDTPPRGANLQQCELAQTYVTGAAGCCVRKPPPEICNGGGSSDTITQIYSSHALGFLPNPIPGEPSESDLVAWLQLGPVQVCWSTPDLAHVALIVGVQPVGGTYRYTVNDPWPVGSGQIRPLTFDQLQPTIPSGYDWEWQFVWHC